MRERITVLGHEVRPLTLGQVEALDDLLARAGDKAAATDKPMTAVRLARAVLKIAFSRDNASVDVDELECDLADLGAAQADVLKLGGFIPAGEAPAAAGANAPTGERSEAA